MSKRYTVKEQVFENAEWQDSKKKPYGFETEMGALAYARGLQWLLDYNTRFVVYESRTKVIIEIVEAKL